MRSAAIWKKRRNRTWLFVPWWSFIHYFVLLHPSINLLLFLLYFYFIDPAVDFFLEDRVCGAAALPEESSFPAYWIYMSFRIFWCINIFCVTMCGYRPDYAMPNISAILRPRAEVKAGEKSFRHCPRAVLNMRNRIMPSIYMLVSTLTLASSSLALSPDGELHPYFSSMPRNSSMFYPLHLRHCIFLCLCLQSVFFSY